MKPVQEPIQVPIDEVELFVVKELERDLQIASLEVLPDPEEGPVADKGHII